MELPFVAVFQVVGILTKFEPKTSPAKDGKASRSFVIAEVSTLGEKFEFFLTPEEANVVRPKVTDIVRVTGKLRRQQYDVKLGDVTIVAYEAPAPRSTGNGAARVPAEPARV